MGRRRDKQLGSRRRQVLQLEDGDGRDSYLAQYGYNSRYGEEEEEMADNNPALHNATISYQKEYRRLKKAELDLQFLNQLPMLGKAPQLGEENMEWDSDERPQDTEDIPLPDDNLKPNGGSHSAAPKEGKKIDSELANFMAEIEAISTVPLPGEVPPEPPATDVPKTKEEHKEDPPAKAKKTKSSNKVVKLEAPVSFWQQCLDENTECYYYWNTQTNEVTWDVPPEFTQYLLSMKTFEEKVAKLQQAGKKVEVCEPGKTGNTQEMGEEGTETDQPAPTEYGPFLPGSDSDKPDDAQAKEKHVIPAAGKLLSADYYSSGEGTDDEGGMDKDAAKPASDQEDEMDFDIDDIDRELELALERKQAETKAPSKSNKADTPEVKEEAIIAEIEPSAVQEVPSVEDQSLPEDPVGEQLRCEDIPFPPSDSQRSEERVQSPAVDTQSNHSSESKQSKSDMVVQKESLEFTADSIEKDKNFKKLLEVKDDRPVPERKEKKVEERKSSKDDRKSSKDERRDDRKDDRKVDRKADRRDEKKSEHREKKKKDDRKEEKSRHRHKHRKEEVSGRSRHASDHKRALSAENDDADSERSRRKRSKHKHRDKDRDKPVPIVISAVEEEAELDVEEDQLKAAEKADEDCGKEEDVPSKPQETLEAPEGPPQPAPEPKEEKSLKETIIDISETVLGKLQFLEVVKEGLTGLQVLLISIETRIADWEAGGLAGDYLLGRLQEAGQQLLRYEEGAAPAGWSTHWDRSYRRYFYTNDMTGESQWDYPDPDTTPPVTGDTSPVADSPGNRSPSGSGEQETQMDEDQESGEVITGLSDVAELGPLVHPGEPPPPGTVEGVEKGDSLEAEAYEVSPAHSVDMEVATEQDGEGEGGGASEDTPLSNAEGPVITRPPLLLGADNPGQAPSIASDVLPEDAHTGQEEGPTTDDVPTPQVAPTPAADGDKHGEKSSDSHHSHHKEKKKKKDRSISSTSLSLKKKKVSSLVQKWQQVQQEVEREEKTSKERESFLHRYSP